MGLDSLQRDLLAEFFRTPTSFFLTGGAALTGYYLDHRKTLDLDLFTAEDDLESGERRLRESVHELGASIEEIQTSVDFRRRLVRRGEEAVVVDLVRDRGAQLWPEKESIGGVRVDRPEEIRANKLASLLGRAEIRDLVDLRALERAGYPVDRSALADAARKDAGLTAAQLAWLLSELRLGPDSSPPGGVAVEELEAFRRELVERLLGWAHP